MAVSTIPAPPDIPVIPPIPSFDSYEVKEGVTVYRNQHFRMIYINTASEWCATLVVNDRPSDNIRVLSKVYNGSDYVDCQIAVNLDGTVKISSLFGSSIPNVQWGYLVNRTVCYRVD